VLGEEITLNVRCGDGLASVRFDPTQLEQVLLNLALNARDAMPGGGRLSIETRARELDAAYAAAHPGVSAGPHVMLAVSDSGTGIAPEVMAHVFEPFYTTKAAGRGTGLGLAMVYGAVKQNAGGIEVRSLTGEGTVFEILLPAVSAVEGPRASPSAGIYPQGNESIVLAEDEPSIRLLATRALQKQGYTVHAFENGRAALDALRDGAVTADLVISDVIMPVMNGAVLAQHLRQWRSGIRILFVSGYPEDVVSHQGVLDEQVDFLTKPYSVGTLARRVREALDREGPP
jgi:CheY-like chemotaxis protein